MTKSTLITRRGFPARNPAATPSASFFPRRDSVIGALISSSIILGVAWIGEQTKGGKPKPAPKEPVPVIEAIPLPKIEPEEPEVVEDTTRPTAELAPPELNDVPVMKTIDSFVQPLQPPRPENVAVDKDLLAIPKGTENWGNGVQIFNPNQLDQQPIPTVQAQPSYPFEMRRAGISGQVVVDFIVDAGGQVRSAFASSSSQREFEAAAVQAVSKWRFKPGRKGGRAVNTHMQVPIVFTLNNGG